MIAGASDGVLANLGVGAVAPGLVACSIGTSGAIRGVVAEPRVDEQGSVFCYVLVPGRWVVGGATNNGGSVSGIRLREGEDALRVAVRSAEAPSDLLAEAGLVVEGPDGLREFLERMVG